MRAAKRGACFVFPEKKAASGGSCASPYPLLRFQTPRILLCHQRWSERVKGEEHQALEGRDGGYLLMIGDIF